MIKAASHTDRLLFPNRSAIAPCVLADQLGLGEQATSQSEVPLSPTCVALRCRRGRIAGASCGVFFIFEKAGVKSRFERRLGAALAVSKTKVKLSAIGEDSNVCARVFRRQWCPAAKRIERDSRNVVHLFKSAKFDTQYLGLHTLELAFSERRVLVGHQTNLPDGDSPGRLRSRYALGALHERTRSRQRP